MYICKGYDSLIDQKLTRRAHMIEAASGRCNADLVFKNATYVNVFTNSLSHGDIAVADGYIVGIGNYNGVREIDVTGRIVLPGLIDAHIHLESAMVFPAEFAKAVLPHGTTTVVTDPHEIANVMGTHGIGYMLQATRGLPVDVHFMLPSCVPATPLDESGASLDWHDLDPFYKDPRVLGLAEMMNTFGVTHNDPAVLSKVITALAHHKLIDGHAPDLSGNDLNTYITAGIYSDHECHSLSEALEKLSRGQFIMIREGTAAHNLEALLPLLTPEYADRCLFCCDDKHPNDLLEKGHIDYIVRRAIAAGVDPVHAVKVASYNAARYFSLTDRGSVSPGRIADLVVIDDFEHFAIRQVYKRGELYADDGCVRAFDPPAVAPALVSRAHDTFHVSRLSPASLADKRLRGVIGLVPGELLTRDCGYSSTIDAAHDILKVAVVERHKDTGHIGIGYLTGYGLTSGAVATSVSHDSHNIIVVGTNEADMALAVNHIIDSRGGIAVINKGQLCGSVALPIAGLMSEGSLAEVNTALEEAKESAFSLGVPRNIDPFMTLSFLSLPVIPTLRLTTRGVIDVETQQFI